MGADVRGSGCGCVGAVAFARAKVGARCTAVQSSCGCAFRTALMWGSVDATRCCVCGLVLELVVTLVGEVVKYLRGCWIGCALQV